MFTADQDGTKFNCLTGMGHNDRNNPSQALTNRDSLDGAKEVPAQRSATSLAQLASRE